MPLINVRCVKKNRTMIGAVVGVVAAITQGQLVGVRAKDQVQAERQGVPHLVVDVDESPGPMKSFQQ